MSPFFQSSECVLVDVEVKPCTYGSPSNSDCSSVILKMTNTPDLIRSSLYNCSVESCNSKFRRRADLVRHKASIHGPKASCSYDGCKYGTGRKDKMKEHIAKIHKRPDRDTQHSPDPRNDHHKSRSYPDILPKFEFTSSPSSDTSSMNMPSSYSGSSIFDTLDNASTFQQPFCSETFSTDASGFIPDGQLDFSGIGNWTEDSPFNDWSSTGSFSGLDASIETAGFEEDFCRYENAFSNFFSAQDFSTCMNAVC